MPSSTGAGRCACSCARPAAPGFATVEWGVIAVNQALHLCIVAMLALLLG
jgi:hypothetical protein